MPNASGNPLTAPDWRPRDLDLPADQIAIGLGWFSIGLGLIELVAPQRLTEAFDMEGHEIFYRLAGAREVAAGVGLLVAREKSPWLWARAAGDVMDVALLSMGLGRGRPANVLAGLAAVAGVAALDVWCAQKMAENEERSAHGASAKADHWRQAGEEIERSITIGKPADELLRLWQQPDTLPRVMAHIADVDQLGSRRARWTVHGPLGRTYTWETQILQSDPDGGLRWEADHGADALVSNGAIRFRKAPADRGTEMTIRLRFDPPGGALGRGMSRLMGNALPGALVDKSLHFFKALAETGEIPTTAHQPAARADTR